MIKKTLFAYILLGIIQIVVGGLVLAGFQIMGEGFANNLSLLQIILGGLIFWTGLYVYVNSKLRNIYAILLEIIINILLIGLESVVSWMNIVILILYLINTIVLLVCIIKYRKI